MSFVRMRFKGQVVWVRVDEAGKPVVDAEGRAEMKYREGDQRSYRPSARNLEPAGDTATADGAGPVVAKAVPLPTAAVGEVTPPPAAKPRPARSADGEVIHVWTDGACTGN